MMPVGFWCIIAPDKRVNAQLLCAGAVLHPPQVCWLVVEYLPGGNLKNWLHGTDAK